MIQSRFDRMNTPCDDCILLFTTIVVLLHCILQFCIDIPDEIDFLVDLLINTVNGCMLAQQQVELEYIKSQGPYKGPNANIVGMLPQHLANPMTMGAAAATGGGFAPPPTQYGGGGGGAPPQPYMQQQQQQRQQLYMQQQQQQPPPMQQQMQQQMGIQ